MGDGGFEPPTSSMSRARLPTCFSMALAGARYVLRLRMMARSARWRLLFRQVVDVVLVNFVPVV